MIKLKTKPEDFIVEEIADLPLVTKSKYRAYILSKNNISTASALRMISDSLEIPLIYFAYGGKKDKLSISSQYITIETDRLLEFSNECCSLEFIGFMPRPMGPDMIEANKFEIVLRDLSIGESEKIKLPIEELNRFGFPNYFDDQRFGSFSLNQGFIGEKIIKEHYNGAVKLYLTLSSGSDNREDNARKQFFFDNWQNWPACLDSAQTNIEKFSFSHLLKHPKDFIFILQNISREEMSLFFSAYQSFLWNEVLAAVIKDKTQSAKAYPGTVNKYLFYETLSETVFNYLKTLNISTVGSRLAVNDAYIDKIYGEIFVKQEIKLSMFNLRKIRQAFFKSYLRPAIVLPEQLSFAIDNDEVYNNQKKVNLKFVLPRGSYATMLIKKLFTN